MVRIEGVREALEPLHRRAGEVKTAAVRGTIAAVKILDTLSKGRRNSAVRRNCVKCRNDVVRTVRSVVNNDVELSVTQHTVDRDLVAGIADEDRNVRSCRKPAHAGSMSIPTMIEPGGKYFDQIWSDPPFCTPISSRRTGFAELMNPRRTASYAGRYCSHLSET